jgi:putative PIN family toxin of toxin-antitoxin system
MTAYTLSLMPVLVIDTNVFVAALRSEGGASRQVLRRALTGDYTPVFGNALWLEYEDVLGRTALWAKSTSERDRFQVLAALAQAGRWVNISFGWRPNLPDEADNHLIELAVAAGAEAIVTHNIRDVAHGELKWAHLSVLTPAQCLEKYP